jgi:hypothetical protein
LARLSYLLATCFPAQALGNACQPITRNAKIVGVVLHVTLERIGHTRQPVARNSIIIAAGSTSEGASPSVTPCSCRRAFTYSRAYACPHRSTPTIRAASASQTANSGACLGLIFKGRRSLLISLMHRLVDFVGHLPGQGQGLNQAADSR